MTEQRDSNRVKFERGYGAHMMAIDGTWRRQCTFTTFSCSGAKLTIEGSIDGLVLKEFFLLLSSTGLAYRRCELAWVNGEKISVNFLLPIKNKKESHIAPRDGRRVIPAIQFHEAGTVR